MTLKVGDGVRLPMYRPGVPRPRQKRFATVTAIEGPYVQVDVRGRKSGREWLPLADVVAETEWYRRSRRGGA